MKEEVWINIVPNPMPKCVHTESRAYLKTNYRIGTEGTDGMGCTQLLENQVGGWSLSYHPGNHAARDGKKSYGRKGFVVDFPPPKMRLGKMR